MVDRFTRADGFVIVAGKLPSTWWVYDSEGRRVKSYMCATVEQADERLTADIERGRV